MNAVFATLSGMIRPREIDSTVTNTQFSRRQLRPREIGNTLLTIPLSIRTSIACTQRADEIEEAPAVCVKAARKVGGRDFEEEARAAEVVQKFVRCFRAQQGVRKDRQQHLAACTLQQWWSKKIAVQIRKSSEAEAIQKLSLAVRQAKARHNYNLSRLATYEIQKFAKRHLSREVYIKQIQQRVATATVLQRWFRSASWNKLKPVVLADEKQEIETDKLYVMYHGTPSLERAALIEQNGFKPSTTGLLGPGVYVSRNVEKAKQYGRGGVVLEVLVRVGRVCHIKDHNVPIPVGPKMNAGAEQRMVPAADLHPRGWSDNGYDTAWVHPGCPDHVFKGGKGWDKGYKEETCVYDADRVTVQRRVVWESDRADVQKIQWLFEEDIDRLKGHHETYERCVPFSRKNSIMLESHYLAFADKRRGGRSKVIVTIEKDQKKFNTHSGFQYEVDLARMKERNVMTGYERRLRRRQLPSSDTTSSTTKRRSFSPEAASSRALTQQPTATQCDMLTAKCSSYGKGRRKGCRCVCM